MRVVVYSAIVLGLLPSLAHAYVKDKYIVNAQYCTSQFPQLEQQYNIPQNLLAAIASTESGRWHDALNMKLPWPWTINAEGKGFYLNSKAEAVAKVRALRAQGITSIDVGCMQVNLKHHPDAFASLEDAFEPAKNVAYAAKFLHSNYKESHSWLTATAAYHSRTPQYGRRYLGHIEKSWTAITDRIGGATTNLSSGGKVVAMRAPNELSELQRAVAKDTFNLGTNAKRRGPSNSNLPTMKVITVRDEEERRKSSMMINSTTRNDSNRSSGAKSISVANGETGMPQGISISVTDTDSGAVQKSRQVNNGPVFIFSD